MSRNNTTPRMRSSRTATSASLGSSSPLRSKLENKRTEKSSGETLQNDVDCWNRFRECAPKIQSQNTEAEDQKVAMNQDELGLDEFSQNKYTMSDLGTENSQQKSESMSALSEHSQSSQLEKSPCLGVEESNDCLEKSEENSEKVEELSKGMMLKSYIVANQSIQSNRINPLKKPSTLSVVESNYSFKKSIYCLLCAKVLARSSSSDEDQNEIGEAVICQNCYSLVEPDVEESPNETGVVDQITSIDSQKKCPGKDSRAWMSPENKVLPSKLVFHVENEHTNIEKPYIDNKDEVEGNKEILALDWYVLNKTREILTPKVRLTVAILFCFLLVISMMYMVYPYALGYLKPSVLNAFPSLKNRLQPTEKHSIFKKLSKFVASPLHRLANKWYWYKKKN